MFAFFDYLKNSWQAMMGTTTNTNGLGSQIRIVDNQEQESVFLGFRRYFPEDVNEEIYKKFLLDFTKRHNLSLEVGVPRAYELWMSLAEAESKEKKKYYEDNFFKKDKAIKAKNQLKTRIKNKAVSKSKKRTSAARKPKRTASNNFKYSSRCQAERKRKATKRKNPIKLIKSKKQQQNRGLKRPLARNPVNRTTSFTPHDPGSSSQVRANDSHLPDMAAAANGQMACPMQLSGYEVLQLLDKIKEIQLNMEKQNKISAEMSTIASSTASDMSSNQNPEQNYGSSNSFQPVRIKQEKISSTDLPEVPVKIISKRYGPGRPLSRIQSNDGDDLSKNLQIRRYKRKVQKQSKLAKVVQKRPVRTKAKKIARKKPKHRKTIRVKDT